MMGSNSVLRVKPSYTESQEDVSVRLGMGLGIDGNGNESGELEWKLSLRVGGEGVWDMLSLSGGRIGCLIFVY